MRDTTSKNVHNDTDGITTFREAERPTTIRRERSSARRPGSRLSKSLLSSPAGPTLPGKEIGNPTDRHRGVGGTALAQLGLAQRSHCLCRNPGKASLAAVQEKAASVTTPAGYLRTVTKAERFCTVLSHLPPQAFCGIQINT